MLQQLPDEEKHPLVNVVVVPEKPRTSVVVLDSSPADGFGNPNFGRDQEVHCRFSSSSAAMDMMSRLSFEDYDEVKSFWYNVLKDAEDMHQVLDHAN